MTKNWRRKNYSWNFFLYLSMIKNCNLRVLMSKLQEKPSALKREHRALQKMKFINFFYVCVSWLGSGSDCESGSGYGSRDPIESGSDPDQNAQHWFLIWMYGVGVPGVWPAAEPSLRPHLQHRLPGQRHRRQARHLQQPAHRCPHHSSQVSARVADPCHFSVDPDPDSDPRSNASWLLDPDPAIFVIDLQDTNKKLIFFNFGQFRWSWIRIPYTGPGSRTAKLMLIWIHIRKHNTVEKTR